MNKTLNWKIAAAPAIVLLMSLSACGGGSGGAPATTVAPTTSSAPADPTTSNSEDPESSTSDSSGAAPSEGELVNLVAEDITNSPGEQLNEDQAHCWADKIVTGLGAARVQELGLDSATGTALKSLGTTELSTEEINKIADGYFDCVDFREMAAEEASTPEDKTMMECIFSDVNDEQLKELFKVEEFGVPPTPELSTLVQDVQAKCVLNASSATG